jgi:hypothetical protein
MHDDRLHHASERLFRIIICPSLLARCRASPRFGRRCSAGGETGAALGPELQSNGLGVHDNMCEVAALKPESAHGDCDILWVKDLHRLASSARR